jgi:hypothetical protein
MPVSLLAAARMETPRRLADRLVRAPSSAAQSGGDYLVYYHDIWPCTSTRRAVTARMGFRPVCLTVSACVARAARARQ